VNLVLFVPPCSRFGELKIFEREKAYTNIFTRIPTMPRMKTELTSEDIDVGKHPFLFTALLIINATGATNLLSSRPAERVDWGSSGAIYIYTLLKH